jgi:hypothetical protein
MGAPVAVGAAGITGVVALVAAPAPRAVMGAFEAEGGKGESSTFVSLSHMTLQAARVMNIAPTVAYVWDMPAAKQNKTKENKIKQNKTKQWHENTHTQQAKIKVKIHII